MEVVVREGGWLWWGRHLCWMADGRYRYWVDIRVMGDLAQAIVRCCDSEVPLGVYAFHASWVAGRSTEWVEDRLMSFLKRKAEMASGEKAKASTLTLKWVEKHPALWEYLAATEYPDSGKRQTSTLLLFVDGAEWKACLRDRDTDHSLWVTAGSLGEVIDDLEALLASGEAQWRRSGQQQGGKKGGK